MDRCLKEHQGSTPTALGVPVARPLLWRTAIFLLLAAVTLTGLIGWPRPGQAVDAPTTTSAKAESASASRVSFHRYVSFDLSPGDASVVVWSPDGKYLAATGILNATIGVFDVQSKKKALQVRRESASEGLAYSPDGKLLAGGSGWNYSDVAVNLWETATGKLRLSIPAAFPKSPASDVRTIAFSPDGRYLAVGYDAVEAIEFGKKGIVVRADKNIFIYEIASGKFLTSFGRRKEGFISTQVVFHPDGIHLAEGIDKGLKARWERATEGDIRIWNVKTGQLVRTIQAHTGSVRALAINPQGNLLISATETGRVYTTLMDSAAKKYETIKILDPIRIWDWKNGRLVRELEGVASTVRSLAFSPDGNLLAAGSYDKTIRVWNTASWQLIGTQNVPEAVMSLSFSPDGKRLAAGVGNQAEVWSLGNRK